MKFNLSAKVMGMVFGKMLKSYYKEHFEDMDMKPIIKDVAKEYRAIIERTPSIGKTMLTGNLIGASYFFAMAKKVPNMTPERMNEITDSAMGSDMMMKMHAKARKKGTLFLEKEQDKWVKDAERSRKSDNEYDWQYTFTKGKDEYFYNYTRCGVCKLAEAEGVLDYLPCMCHMDYSKFRMKGAKLIRTKTLAAGDPCCDFHLVRIKENECEKTK